MSTRGYLTVVDGEKNILSAAFYPSSAYPSYLGLEVLDAFKNQCFGQFIENINQEYPEEKEMLAGIQRDWYVKGKENQDGFFHDYAYEFNAEKGDLTVFHFGNKALTIPYEKIPLFKYIFEHEDSLYYPLCFDEKSMTLKKDFYTEIRKMLKAGANEQAFMEQVVLSAGILYLDQGRVIDSWNRDNQSFNKYARTSNGKCLKLCVSDYYGKFHLYVQTPFIRAPISNQTYSSPKAAEKAIADILRTRPHDVRTSMSFFQELEGFLKTVKEIFANDTASLKDCEDMAYGLQANMLARLNDITGSCHLLGDHDRLFERMIKDTVRNQYRYAKERLEQSQTQTSLSSSLAQAASRAETAASNHNVKSQTTPER